MFIIKILALVNINKVLGYIYYWYIKLKCCLPINLISLNKEWY